MISLEQTPRPFGAERRWLRVVKPRVVKFSGGLHDFILDTGGLIVFPRLVAADQDAEFDPTPKATGSKELDDLLGGGLVPGTNTLLVGPSGVGKTTSGLLPASWTPRLGVFMKSEVADVYDNRFSYRRNVKLEPVPWLLRAHADATRASPRPGTRIERVLSFLRDYSTIVRAGVFMHSAYALRYLGTRRWIVVALAHYLLVGERRGHRPNPFFDPTHTGGLRLATYLRDARTWGRAPCPQVDPAWYRAQHMPADARGSPFVHFWRSGFDRDCSPSLAFDLAFFKAVVAFYRADKTEFAFECFTAADADVPNDEAEVCRRQQAFYDTVVMTVPRRLACPRHRFLVFVQAGRDFYNPHRGPRSFDVLVNYYDDAPVHDDAADYIVLQNGTKTTAVRKLLDDAPDILGAYEAVLFIDDDVVLETAAIDRLFAIFVARGLDLAQPSLTAASYCAFAILKQPDAGLGVRGLTSVEIMMPLLSKRALAACGFCFGEAISGWAVDLLLGVEVRRRFGDRVALIGEIVAAHERHVDLQGGAFYAFLRKHGIEATTEAGRIARRFGIAVSAEAILPAPLDEPQAG